ncbi:hypothetical protein SAMN05877809_105154, partial [Rhodobacter sp. JA431]|uniref:beta strand repeat-containing protein n=1 Tax=Rhodobacter sp. JA431 TaxID=570013 RepID=UPI000BCCE77C
MALQTVNFIDGHQTRRAQFAAPKRLLHSTALALVMAAMPMSLSAQVIWDGSSDTNWDDGTNWVGDAAPGGGDTAEFSDNTAVNQPTLNSDQSVAATTISTGILTIPNHLTSPTVAISGTGTVTVDTASGILTSATGVTITDSGTFNLVNSSTLQGSATLSAGSSATFTLNGGLVTNDLTINGGTANLTSGVVSGTTSVAAPVSVTNNATLSAVSNAGTFVNASTAGAVTNSGDGTNDGTIASLSNTGGTFLNNDTITGGVDVSAGTVTNAATGAMNGGALVSGGALENAGQIAGDVSVTGGAFTLSDGSSVTVGAASGDVTIGNDSGAATFVATGTSSIAGAFSVGAQGTATVGDSVTPVATALTVSGTTDVTGAGGNAAALSVVGGATFNTGNVTVGSDGTLTVGDADALTLENMNVGGG